MLAGRLHNPPSVEALGISGRQLLLEEDFAAGTIQDGWRWRFL